jgi:gluconate kinase
MKLIFIFGPAASGKLTVGRELSALTGIPLFHNHLVVDALLEKLPFGDPEFVRLREAMWMAAFETAVKAGRSLIFTFAPEPTVRPGFPERVVELIREHGGEVRFVRLELSSDEQERRIANESRKEFRKLVSVDQLRSLRKQFEASEAEMPPADLVIDTEDLSPPAAARQISAAFGLSA